MPNNDFHSIRLALFALGACLPVACFAVTESSKESQAEHGAAEIVVAEQSPPNILFLYIDDLDFDEIEPYSDSPADHPSNTGAFQAGQLPPKEGLEWMWYDNPKMMTPNIRRLAEEGGRFDRFYVTTSICTPSRFSLFTGRYATRSAQFLEKYPAGGPSNLEWDAMLGPQENNLFKMLRARDYTTGLVGKWHNGIPVGTEAQSVRDLDEYKTAFEYLSNVDNFGIDHVDRVIFANPMPFNLEWITEGAVEYLEKQTVGKAEQPFFLYVAIPVPHHQYEANWLEEDPRAMPGPLKELSDDEVPNVQPSRQGVIERAKAAGLPDRNAAAGWLDDAVGAILGALEKSGQAKNTLVFLVSDHQSRGKFDNYEGCRVPAFVRWPGVVNPGTVYTGLFANVDLAPTILAAAGGNPKEVKPPFDGSSFLPVLEGEQPEGEFRDHVLLEVHSSRAIVTPKWKYIANRPTPEIAEAMEADARRAKEGNGRRVVSWNGRKNWNEQSDGVLFDADTLFPHYFETDQLYDLENDIFEQRNVLSENPEKVKELQKLLSEDLESMPHTFGEFKTQ